MLAAAPAALADFAAGTRAYDAGDYATALQEWLPLAREGDVAAQRNIGLLYQTGRGVDQDLAEAARWYRRAAEDGFDRAQANLGAMYLNGEGVKKDYAEARKWFEKAALQGHVVAQYNLGVMYETGLGVPVSEPRAAAWYNLAARAGHRGALDRLSHLVALKPAEDAQKQPPSANPPATQSAAPPAAAPAARPAPAKSPESLLQPPTPPAPTPVVPAAKPPPAAAAAGADKNAPAVPSNGTLMAGLASLVGIELERPRDLEGGAPRPAPSPPPAAAAAAPPPSPPPATPTEPPAKSGKGFFGGIASLFSGDEQPSPAPPGAARPGSGQPAARASAPPPIGAADANTARMNDLARSEAERAYAAGDYQTAMARSLPPARAGDAEAQYRVGRLYRDGLGVPPDRIRAYVWWTYAARQGHLEAGAARAALGAIMTAGQRAEAEELAASFPPR